MEPIRRIILLAIIAVVALTGCPGDKRSPEEQIRALVADAAQAAERKDVSSMVALISERYSDTQGQNRKALEGMLRLLFLRHESVHVYTRIQEIALLPSDRARLTVYAALASLPIAGEAQLRGDLYRFDLELVRENRKWRVISAAWQPADISGP
jgi:hypothetical protein